MSKFFLSVVFTAASLASASARAQSLPDCERVKAMVYDDEEKITCKNLWNETLAFSMTYCDGSSYTSDNSGAPNLTGVMMTRMRANKSSDKGLIDRSDPMLRRVMKESRDYWTEQLQRCGLPIPSLETSQPEEAAAERERKNRRDWRQSSSNGGSHPSDLKGPNPFAAEFRAKHAREAREAAAVNASIRETNARIEAELRAQHAPAVGGRSSSCPKGATNAEACYRRKK